MLSQIREAAKAMPHHEHLSNTWKLLRLLPLIEQARSMGFKNPEILQALLDAGFTLSQNSFKVALQRARRKAVAAPETATKATTAAAAKPPKAPPETRQGGPALTDNMTPKQRAQATADYYTSTVNSNPLLRRKLKTES